MHLFAPEIGMMGTSGIVGPCILQAAGAGYSFRILKTPHVAVAFFGDGAVNNVRIVVSSNFPLLDQAAIEARGLEPLAAPDCNYINMLAEASSVVQRIGNPAFRSMVDTLAASLMETEPVAEIIRRWMPTGMVAHVQLNDRNKKGPGQGSDRFGPVLQALSDTGYDGWVAMEPFIYEPDGPTCAARMIGYVQGLLEEIA